MVVNLLCAAQVSVAVRFARPDLYGDPFASTAYGLTAEELPILAGSLGALSCQMVGTSWPLNDLARLEGEDRGKWGGNSVEAGLTSELFIARVVRVERVPRLDEGEGDELRTLPLVYRRRGYMTSTSIPMLEDC